MSIFQEYTALQRQIKALQAQADSLKAQIIAEMPDTRYTAADGSQFSVSYRKKWNYTANVIEAEEMLKGMKRPKNGAAPPPTKNPLCLASNWAKPRAASPQRKVRAPIPSWRNTTMLNHLAYALDTTAEALEAAAGRCSWMGQHWAEAILDDAIAALEAISARLNWWSRPAR